MAIDALDGIAKPLGKNYFTNVSFDVKFSQILNVHF